MTQHLKALNAILVYWHGLGTYQGAKNKNDDFCLIDLSRFNIWLLYFKYWYCFHWSDYGFQLYWLKKRMTMAYVNTSNTSNNILEKNCRGSWPHGLCIFANVCGLISAGIWFIVLFPQIWKNFRRKSVTGLSILWATANFTASFINLFFTFKGKLIYFRYRIPVPIIYVHV